MKGKRQLHRQPPEKGALPRKLFLYLSRVFTNASSHTGPSFSSPTCVVSADFLSPTHSLEAGGSSLESVSLLEDEVEVYAALQFGNVSLPPQGVVVNIVPLNSYNAELSPTLKGEPKAPEFMASQTQLFFDVIEFPSFFHQGDWTILLQSFASKMTKLKQNHCKCISPLFPMLFLRWQR